MGKHKRGKAGGELPARPAGGMAIASGWPVYDVLLSRGWDQEGALSGVLIARRSPSSGKVAAGSFLVDLGCLGVKSAQVKLFKSAAEYAAGLRAHVMSVQPMAPADFNLAVKIIRTGLAYAARLGFKPDPVYAQAEPLLAGADLDAAPPVRVGGPEGKPFFINGPNDDVAKVIAQLRRAVGDGNFQVLIGGPEGLPFPLDELGDDEDGEPADRAWRGPGR
jgi:hypothetical protein